jgi:hypothetical protein
MARLSIIIPVLDEGEGLAATLDALSSTAAATTPPSSARGCAPIMSSRRRAGGRCR